MSDAKNLVHGHPFPPVSAPSYTTFTLNESADAVEVVFMADEAATITKLGFRYGSRTGTPPTFKISLQGVTGAGVPDGTIKGGGSPASKTFTPPADTTWNSAWQWITLDNSYTCTRGELLALVIKYDSGTIDGSNNSSFTELINGGTVANALPYMIQNNNGTRTLRPLLPVFGYASASKVFGCPSETHVAQAIFGSSGTPDEIGTKFTVPGSGTFTVGAVEFFAAMNPGGTADVTLYDTDGTTVLQRVTIDTDASSSSSFARWVVPFDETTLSALTLGSTYTLSIAPSGTITVYGLEVDAAADWDAWPGGQDWVYRTRTDAGAWTDNTARRLFLAAHVKDVTSSGGGGGGIIVPGGMQGGLRG